VAIVQPAGGAVDTSKVVFVGAIVGAVAMLFGCGAVNEVKQDFTSYVSSLRRYGRSIYKVVWAQSGNYGDYLSGKERAQRYGERVQSGLDKVAQELQGIPAPDSSAAPVTEVYSGRGYAPAEWRMGSS